MSIAFIYFGLMVMLVTQFVVEVSVWIGVVGCVYHISVKIFLMYTSSFTLMNSVLNSVSTADDITALMSWAVLEMDPFVGGFCHCLNQKSHPLCFWYLACMVVCITVYRQCHVAYMVCHNYIFL